MLLKQVMSEDRSCAKAVNDFIILNNDTKISASSSAYWQARIKLSTELIKKLVRSIANKVINLIAELWRYKERKVFIVEGSTGTMPDNKESQKKYPQQNSQKQGLGFPIC